MALENLLPISDYIAERVKVLDKQKLGAKLLIHTKENGQPDLEGVELALIGIRENRGNTDILTAKPSFSSLRSTLYNLYPGNWHTTMADLGDIDAGNTIEDTFYAAKQLTEILVKKGIIPIFLGGSHNLTYAIYRAYDNLDQMVNLVNVDAAFDLGDSSQPQSSTSYISKIIVDKPYNLFNYANLGYQTFYNSQEEIALMDKLYFDAFRLGDIISDTTQVEPVLRDADVVSIDLGAVQSSSIGFMHKNRPNGFNGREICAIARYAGISDRVSSLGIFEFLEDGYLDTSSNLVAQIIWYFIEGVNYRVNELVPELKGGFLRYAVPVDDEVLSFYKSERTGRWWIEIPFLDGVNNKLKRHTLLPCTYQDYENACNQEIPERWFKARQKNEL